MDTSRPSLRTNWTHLPPHPVQAGIDGGGLFKEFVNTLSRQVAAPPPPPRPLLQVRRRWCREDALGSRLSWFGLLVLNKCLTSITRVSPRQAFDPTYGLFCVTPEGLLFPNPKAESAHPWQVWAHWVGSGTLIGYTDFDLVR